MTPKAIAPTVRTQKDSPVNATKADYFGWL